jgi:hypothetical protein
VSETYFCRLCVLAGRPAGERFEAPADPIGRALMQQHVLEPHPAQSLRSAVPGGEPVDIALTETESGGQ